MTNQETDGLEDAIVEGLVEAAWINAAARITTSIMRNRTYEDVAFSRDDHMSIFTSVLGAVKHTVKTSR